jgi:hypothetical protein
MHGCLHGIWLLQHGWKDDGCGSPSQPLIALWFVVFSQHVYDSSCHSVEQKLLSVNSSSRIYIPVTLGNIVGGYKRMMPFRTTFR